MITRKVAYSAKKIDQASKALESAAPQERHSKIYHDDAMETLTKQIKMLYIERNYDARQISKLLRKEGILSTINEINKILGIQEKS